MLIPLESAANSSKDSASSPMRILCQCNRSEQMQLALIRLQVKFHDTATRIMYL